MVTVGAPLRRVEDPRLLVGEGCYVCDLDLPGVLTVAYLTSTVPHARLSRVDVAGARRSPGIVDVVTAADLDVPPAPFLGTGNVERMLRPMLATGVVRFVGEPIAAVVGETAAACADAVERIEVDYEPLPTVVRPEEALRGEVLLFPDVGSNVVVTQGGGTPRPLPFGDCELVVEGVLVNQRLAPCPMETRAGASWWDEDGRLHHWSACQGAHYARTLVAEYYGLPLAQVRVVAPDVGGSFGAKGRPYPEELLLPELARRAGRPVRWVPTRSADMIGLGHARAQQQHVRIGGDRDGTIRCLDVHIVGDAGAYPHFAAMTNSHTGGILPGPYRIPHVAWSSETVLTNTTPVGSLRGAGRPEAGALLERALDLWAAELGMDPVAARRRNLLSSDELPYVTPIGLTIDTGDYDAALDLLLEDGDYDGLRAEQVRRRADGDRRLLGIGVALFIDRTGGAPRSQYSSVELLPGGGLRLLTGSSPHGQGHATTWAMIASDRTGIPVERIEVVHGDTDLVPRGAVTGGSSSAQLAGSAVVLSVDALVADARVRAADLLEAAPDDIVLDVASGRFGVRGAPGGRTATWAEVAALPAAEPLRCEADFDLQKHSCPFGAYLVVVEVDADTGEVELRRVITVDDAGTIINPLLAEGQVHGGLVQALGQGLFEEFRYDDEGNPLSGNFVDYLLPGAADMPWFEGHLLETPTPLNPLGAKGIGESGSIGGTPAVQSAVVDAVAHLGIRHLDLPLTPERVWHAIQVAGG